ncbi:hypothetical protein I3760_14G121100 [Carya illinoinensis]|uniref:Uncharacterized protein n=1 Tax=Carya illinoinensis TaxID=32201 RepID=A0A8T1NJH8_CARIL|nr:cyclin-dependent protein kinase inhibitor SMR13-like [Carya illinoinensis]KAG2671170.1 hypothetical protein I3760_14G121100 [Carya illinoinensis]KAG6629932.1 hypothetical protein CIPAW_14G118800 [Carya illinoinensis]KAG6679269.1 hypothetical protein I3842_14G122000 [Carya illinoinensis]
MAPSGQTKARPTRKARRRNHSKKRIVHSKNQEASRSLPPNSSTTSSSDFPKVRDIDFEGVEVPSSGCSTPKAQRFRIPEISTCPPAPKKQRVVSNCSLQRTPIAFFAPPDLELFFFFALRDISV